MDNIMDNITDLLGNMSDEEFNSLKETAQKLFSEETGETVRENHTDGFSLSPDMIAKLGRIMSLLNQKNDGRDGLIAALKPYLSAPRQKKADEAMKFLRLMDILPLISQSGLFG